MKEIKKTMVHVRLSALVVIWAFLLLAALLTGCAHNINVQGFGIACPYGAMGYGTFSCVKDNTSVESTEETTKEGVKTTNKFVTGDQITGYDVELTAKKKGGGMNE